MKKTNSELPIAILGLSMCLFLIWLVFSVVDKLEFVGKSNFMFGAGVLVGVEGLSCAMLFAEYIERKYPDFCNRLRGDVKRTI